MITVTLPGEPVGKGRPRFRVVALPGRAPFGTVYTPKATRDYENGLKLVGRAAMRGRPPLDGPIEVVVLAVMSIPRSWTNKKRDAALAGTVWPTGTPDIDNVMKMLDALNEVVWNDDSQIVRAGLEKRYGENPRLQVNIRTLEEFDIFSQRG